MYVYIKGLLFSDLKLSPLRLQVGILEYDRLTPDQQLRTFFVRQRETGIMVGGQWGLNREARLHLTDRAWQLLRSTAQL